MKTLFFVHDTQSSPAPRLQYLEDAGYHVVPLQSTTEALRAVGQNKPDALLLDVLLDGMNGFELATEVRKQFDAAQLPIVIFSGIYRGRVYSEESLNVGAQAYLTSPVNLDSMIATVVEIVEGGGSGETRRAG